MAAVERGGRALCGQGKVARAAQAFPGSWEARGRNDLSFSTQLFLLLCCKQTVGAKAEAGR